LPSGNEVDFTAKKINIADESDADVETLKSTAPIDLVVQANVAQR
jgi:hypothetical protein